MTLDKRRDRPATVLVDDHDDHDYHTAIEYNVG